MLDLDNVNAQVCIATKSQSQIIHLDRRNYRKSPNGENRPRWVLGPDLPLSGFSLDKANGVVSPDLTRFFIVGSSDNRSIMNYDIFAMSCHSGKCEVNVLPQKLRRQRSRPALILISDPKDLKKCWQFEGSEGLDGFLCFQKKKFKKRNSKLHNLTVKHKKSELFNNLIIKSDDLWLII